MAAVRQVVPSRRLSRAIEDFLTDLTHANRSPTTVRAYRSDLAAFARQFTGPPENITAEVLRDYFATLTHLAPATRARREASLGSFLRWAYRQDLITANPMDRLDRVHLEPPPPRGVPRTQVEQILAAIPRDRARDRLLFRLLAETGLRVGETLGLHVDDLNLTVDDEHISVTGKGGRRRTVLLDEPRLVAELRRYLEATGYTHGPIFRAERMA